MEVHMSQNEEQFDEIVEAFAENEHLLLEEQTLTNEEQSLINEEQTLTNEEQSLTDEEQESSVELKPFYRSWLMYFLLLAFGLFIGTNLYFKSQITINAPEVDLGEKVVVILENGQEMKTYENLLVEKEKKIYYKGEFNTIDITKGIIVYKDWE